MVEKSDVSDILSKKCLLIKGLEENIFKDFTSEEEDLLHSKHGRIKVWHKSGVGKVYDGITGAFKVGLPVIINCNPVKTVPKITTIDLELEGLVPKCIIDAKFYLKEFILLHESINN